MTRSSRPSPLLAPTAIIIQARRSRSCWRGLSSHRNRPSWVWTWRPRAGDGKIYPGRYCPHLDGETNATHQGGSGYFYADMANGNVPFVALNLLWVKASMRSISIQGDRAEDLRSGQRYRCPGQSRAWAQMTSPYHRMPPALPSSLAGAASVKSIPTGRKPGKNTRPIEVPRCSTSPITEDPKTRPYRGHRGPVADLRHFS